METLKILTCNRCGYQWATRNEPKNCANPKCRSPYWNKERRIIKYNKKIMDQERLIKLVNQGYTIRQLSILLQTDCYTISIWKRELKRKGLITETKRGVKTKEIREQNKDVTPIGILDKKLSTPYNTCNKKTSDL